MAYADVAQLVERNLAMVEVAGSYPVVRLTNYAEVAQFGRASDFQSECCEIVPRLPLNIFYGRVFQWKNIWLTSSRRGFEFLHAYFEK